MAAVPRYVSLDDVKYRLAEKVNFSGLAPLPDPRFPVTTSTSMNDEQLAMYINKGASQVEFALSPLYTIPFVNIDGTGDFTTLPEMTQDFIKELVINRASVIILRTNFTKDSGVKGAEYIKELVTEWRENVEEKLLRRSPEGKYLYPPLPELAYNADQFDLSAPMQAPITISGAVTDNLTYANRHILNTKYRTWFGYPWGY